MFNSISELDANELGAPVTVEDITTGRVLGLPVHPDVRKEAEAIMSGSSANSSGSQLESRNSTPQKGASAGSPSTVGQTPSPA